METKVNLTSKSKVSIKYDVTVDGSSVGVHTYNIKTRGHSLVVDEKYDDLEFLFHKTRTLVNTRLHLDIK